MRKISLTLICAVVAFAANAQFKFKSLNNNDGATTIVVADDNWNSGTETCCAKFHNDGNTYEAESMVSTQQGKQLSITMTFKRLTVFNNMSITLTVNGQEVNVPLDLTEVADQLIGYKLLVP